MKRPDVSGITLLTVLCTGLMASVPGMLHAQDAPSRPGPSPITTDTLPVDPQVHLGKLDNGLTYLIRRNDRPEDRAELRLVVNAGSVLEDDDQRGLAHFVEHMAFNGTDNYAEHEIIDYLESIGMRFGPDVNAYTSFDETVYMLQVPTDSAQQLQTGFDILREWATNLAFDEKEIDKERGVVIEEWRLRRGANARIQDEQFPVLFHGSRYAERLPIGQVDVLQNFPYDAARRFYHTWYRPDLMAVIAVGDFDPAEVEETIRAKFSNIPKAREAPPRPTYDLPDHEETLVSIVTDPEAPYTTVGVIYKQPKRDYTTVGDYRQQLVEWLYNGMFNDRLQELTQNADPPFIAASSGQGGFVRAKEFYTLNALVREGAVVGALNALLTEAERVQRYGFTPGEFERQKTDILRSLERAYNERDKSESSGYASEYVRHFLTDEPIPGIAYEYEVSQQLLPTIALDEVNSLAKAWLVDENRVLLVDGPENVSMPTEEELLATFARASDAEVTPYEDTVSEEPLLSSEPAPGTIVDSAYDEELGVTRLTLSNGAQVVLKPTDFKNDEILFGAQSPGGTSVVPDAAYIPAVYAATLIGQSGVGRLGPIELQKKLSGKVVRVNPYIGSLSEGFSGSAAPSDLETMLQLVYLYFTAPRADSVAYESFKKRISDLIMSMQADPEQAFRDTLAVTLAQHHPRSRPFTQETIAEMDLAKSLQIFEDRFADASDFTFYLVGSFDVEAVEPLLLKYLGGLPANDRDDQWRDVGIRPPEGIVERAVYRGIEPKSQVEIVFNGPFAWSLDNRRELQALADVLRIKLRETLREDMSGTYGVSVQASRRRIPTESYSIDVSFGCDPERAEELTATVFSVIDTLKAQGASEKYLTKVRETNLREYQENMKENRFWLASLQFYDENEEAPVPLREGPDAFLARLSSDMIKEAARQYLDTANYVKVALYPEDFAGKQGADQPEEAP